jgi:hypothetical protein
MRCASEHHRTLRCTAAPYSGAWGGTCQYNSCCGALGCQGFPWMQFIAPMALATNDPTGPLAFPSLASHKTIQTAQSGYNPQ